MHVAYDILSNFRGGNPNLSIKSERDTTGTVMLHSHQGVEW